MKMNTINQYMAGVGLLLSLLMLFIPDYAAATDKRHGEIEALAESFHNALSTKDEESAMATFSNDVLIMEGGHVQTKEEYVSHHLNADMNFVSSITTKRKVIRSVVEGNTGWIISTSISTGKYKDRDINSSGAELMVVKRQNDDDWKIAAIHWSSHSQ